MTDIRPLPDALDRLDQVVRDLCDPPEVVVLRDGLTTTEHVGDSLLNQISATGHGGEIGKSRGGANRLPVSAAKLDAWLEIQASASDLHDRAVMHTRPTVEQYVRRIAELAHGWSDPQAVLWVVDHLRVWREMILGVLEPPRRVSIAAACPTCRARMVLVAEPGTRDRVQVDALQVTMEDGRPTAASCMACRASWAPQQFEFLGRLIGCEPVREAS